MKNRITDLRNHLFAALEGLADQENPMELDRAKAIADVSQTLINSAKVEVDYIKATGRLANSGFIPEQEQPGIGATNAAAPLRN